MKMLILYIIGILIFISPHSVIASNASFRCGNDLITRGQTMYQVQLSCGEPDFSQVVGEKTTYRIHKKKRLETVKSIYMTEWTYERRNGIYLLTFEGSRLVKKVFIFS